MKVFKLNECEWWAGEDFESVVAAAMAEERISREDLLDGEEHELTEKELDKFVFHDVSLPSGEEVTRSFREELLRQIDSGGSFPRIFAIAD